MEVVPSIEQSPCGNRGITSLKVVLLVPIHETKEFLIPHMVVGGGMIPICNYGDIVVTKMAKTTKNAGSQFWGVGESSNEMSCNFSKWCSMATNTHLGFIPNNFLLNGGSTSGKVVIHRINDGDMCLFICGSSESTWNIIFMTTRDVTDHPFPATTLFVVQVYSDLVSFQRSIGLIYCDRCFSTISHVTFDACPRGTKASTHVLYLRLIYTSHEGKIFHGQVTETDSGKGDGSGTTHDRQGHDMSRQIETQHYCSRLHQNFIQCAVYDSDELGVEYIVSDDIFETMPPDSGAYWETGARKPCQNLRKILLYVVV
ncbi:hypothetical protein V8G54_000055 (mitochondrion) [Vigna mungo]|uniref:Uncharacterized protein n=1 Tax=Vigna mungo TaxID=3915 RepID=A0AAQ3PLA3_VIGMU